MALRPYSVSPRRLDHTVGPKPTMNCGTRMPNRRAQKKCPNSWKAMEKSSPIPKATMPRTVRRTPLRSTSGDDAPGVLPGPALRGQHVLDAGGCAQVRRLVEGTRDEVEDAPERQATRTEGGHRLLVGRVVERRDDSPGLSCRPGQPDGRDGVVVQGVELPG